MAQPVSTYGFRTQQAVQDLVDHARAAPPEILAKIGPDALPELRGLIHNSRCRIETKAQLELHTRLLLAAASPETGEACLVATAILLADLLQDGLGPDALDWHWQAHHAFYRAAVPTFRAALMHGFARAHEKQLLTLDPSPEPLDMLSCGKETIMPALLAMARAAPDSELESIARGDYGMDVDKHFSVLKTLINDQNGLLRDDQYWYPSEVIELVAYVRDTAGFVTCTALLLLNALAKGDVQGWFDFRWHRLGPDYRALPDNGRGPILAGLRYLYESDPEFLGFYSGSSGGWAEDRLIPVVDFRS